MIKHYMTLANTIARHRSYYNAVFLAGLTLFYFNSTEELISTRNPSLSRKLMVYFCCLLLFLLRFLCSHCKRCIGSIESQDRLTYHAIQLCLNQTVYIDNRSEEEMDQTKFIHSLFVFLFRSL